MRVEVDVLSVIACNKRKAFVQGRETPKQSSIFLSRKMDCFASLAMTVADFAPQTRRVTRCNIATSAAAA
jgi:hypothetical protein